MRISSPTIIQMILLCVSISVTGCTQSSQEETVITTTIYDGCCGTAPKVYEVEDLKVYIPNVITANGDGINDVFIPLSNKITNDSFYVVDFFIYDTTNTVIYYARGLDIEKPENWGFTGVASTRPFLPDEQANYKYTGKFSYKFAMGHRRADNTFTRIEVDGEACLVRCDDDVHVLKSKSGCYFPIQGVNGTYNPNIPNQEDKCIK